MAPKFTFNEPLFVAVDYILKKKVLSNDLFRFMQKITLHETRIQGVQGARIQVKGMEIKTLDPSNPGILEPCSC
jgi:hypothetical protein